MRLFITGTDTDVGKTVVSSWLCLHTGFDYVKPIQTGGAKVQERDRYQVQQLSRVHTHNESYLLRAPLSPHQAATLENVTIDVQKMILPSVENLIIEGAGGVLVPLNAQTLMIDLIQRWQVPVIVVARTSLGTLNHTLLTLEALRRRHIPILGVILKGLPHAENAKTIAAYGRIDILASVPHFDRVNRDVLQQFPLPQVLKTLLTPEVLKS